MRLAVPGKGVDAVLSDLKETPVGKTIIDVANTISQAVIHSLDLLKPLNPNVKGFRAFNPLGGENAAESERGGVRSAQLPRLRRHRY